MLVGVVVGVTIGDAVGVTVGLSVGVSLGVAVGVSTGVTDGVGVGGKSAFAAIGNPEPSKMNVIATSQKLFTDLIIRIASQQIEVLRQDAAL